MDPLMVCIVAIGVTIVFVNGVLATWKQAREHGWTMYYWSGIAMDVGLICTFISWAMPKPWSLVLMAVAIPLMTFRLVMTFRSLRKSS